MTNRTLTSDALAVVVEPLLGGCIAQVRHVPSDQDILAETPWRAQCAGTAPLVAGTGPTGWLERYPGGWQEILPNAGPALTVDDVAQTWHGEASLNPFELIETSAAALILERRLVAAPLHVRRVVAVDGHTVSVSDQIRNVGSAPYHFLWQHHPAFGADLLSRPCRLRFGGGGFLVGQSDVQHHHQLWAPDADSRELRPGVSSLECGTELPPRAWVSLEQLPRHDARQLGVVLAWDGRTFPLMWLWQETGGDPGPPWFGRLRAVALEPAQAWPVTGLARLDEATHGAGTWLEPGQEMESSVLLGVRVGADAVEELLAEVDARGWPTTRRSGTRAARQVEGPGGPRGQA